MSLLQDFKNYVKGIKPSQAQMPIRFAGTIMSSSREIDIKKFFANWSGICVNKRSSAIAGIDQFVTVNDKTITTHWLSDLIETPNINMSLSWYDTKELLVRWLDYTGNAYLWFPLNGYKYPTQCYVLPSDRVYIVPKETGIDYYKFYTQTGSIDISPYELCHIKTIKPSSTFQKNFYLGSPICLESALDAIEADADIKAYLKETFNTDSISPLYLTHPSSFESPEQIAQMKQTISNQNLNRKIAIALDSGMELKEIPTSSIGKETVNSLFSKETNAILICSAFGVPFGLVDTTSQQNVATAEVNYKTFNEDTVEPLMKKIEQSLNSFFNQFEPNVKLTHNPYEYKDTNYELIRQKQLLDYGVITVNDIRQDMQLPLIDNGNFRLIPSGFITWDQLLNPQPVNNPITLSYTPTVTKQLQVKDYSNMSEEEKTIEWKKHEDYLKPYRDNLQNSIKSGLEYIRDYASDTIKSKGRKDALSQFTTGFDLNYLIQYIEQNTSEELTKYVKAVVKKAIRDTGSDTVVTDWEKLIKDTVKKSSSKISESINTLKDNIKAEIETLLQNNPMSTSQEIKDKINGLFDGTETNQGYIKTRSEMIAITTATNANGQAQTQMFKELGYKSIWMTQRDGEVRTTHRMADGSKPDENGYFHVGTDQMKYPASGSVAAENVRCRCYLFPQK